MFTRTVAKPKFKCSTSGSIFHSFLNRQRVIQSNVKYYFLYGNLVLILKTPLEVTDFFSVLKKKKWIFKIFFFFNLILYLLHNLNQVLRIQIHFFIFALLYKKCVCFQFTYLSLTNVNIFVLFLCNEGIYIQRLWMTDLWNGIPIHFA